MMRLQGRAAIVTGGARGLGRTFALALAREGASVLVMNIGLTEQDRIDLENTVEQIRAEGGSALPFEADVSSEEETCAMAEAAVEAFGRVDILVNNAAVYDGIRRRPFHEIDLAEWDLVMRVNVKGVFLAVRAVFPHMKARSYGRIVNIASEVFFTGSTGFAHYVTSKGGVMGLTRALAAELGPHGIGINAVAPGFTDTEASRRLADVSKYDTSKTPLGRVGTPEDIAGAVLYLASSESDFLTGQTLLVDGGRVMH
jgi:3-oxoacyl-[acyl-carrier protein] reductase